MIIQSRQGFDSFDSHASQSMAGEPAFPVQLKGGLLWWRGKKRIASFPYLLKQGPHL